MTDHIDVFISSTFSDLEAVRLELRNVIIGLGMYPIDMVDFEPSNRNALQMCYDKLQDAEIFIGIYAHRYGYAPSREISYKTKTGEVKTGDGETGITDWEYQWAQEMGIPCLLFVIEKTAPWNPEQMDKDTKALSDFKAHIQTNHIVNFFSNKEDLKLKVLQGLVKTMPQYVTNSATLNKSVIFPKLNLGFKNTLSKESIFISYSRKDWDDFVVPLHTALQQRAIPYWLDQHLLQGGDDWMNEIGRALEICDRMILCMSEDALQSRFVQMEYRQFIRENKKIYPLICRSVLKLPFELAGIHYHPYDQLDDLIDILLNR